MKRHTDGTWRGTRQASITSNATLRARFVEAETVHLKRMGLSFEAIAEHITAVGGGREQAITTIPQGVTFPADYQVTKQACHKAFRNALGREPSLEIEEFRKLDTARCEEMLLNLQPAIRKGHVRSIEAGIKVLEHTTKVNGYAAPNRHELTGKDGKPLTLVQLLDAIGPITDED
jgi:hypothetical protein